VDNASPHWYYTYFPMAVGRACRYQEMVVASEDDEDGSGLAQSALYYYAGEEPDHEDLLSLMDLAASAPGPIVSAWYDTDPIDEPDEVVLAGCSTDELGNMDCTTEGMMGHIGWFVGNSAACAGFLDTLSLAQTHWAHNYIAQIHRWGVVEGYGGGLFGPDDNFTRGQAAKMVLEAQDAPDPDPMLDDPADDCFYELGTFADVSCADWFANYVMQAYWNEHIEGYGDGTFRPNQPVTRAELAAMMARKMMWEWGLEDLDDLVEDCLGPSDGFPDTAGHWAEDEIAAVACWSMVDGYPDGTFKPDQLVTRGEASKMFYRLVGFMNMID